MIGALISELQQGDIVRRAPFRTLAYCQPLRPRGLCQLVAHVIPKSALANAVFRDLETPQLGELP